MFQSPQCILTWIPDSPYSRIAKWVLYSSKVTHTDNVITWDTLNSDPGISEWNPKRQVPILHMGSEVVFDSFVIMSRFIDIERLLQGPSGVWLRTADDDLDRVIFFLARAKAARDLFKTDGNDVYLWLEKAAKDLFVASLQALEKSILDNEEPRQQPSVPEVAVLSMLLSIVSLAPEYLQLIEEFKFSERLKVVEKNDEYRIFIEKIVRSGSSILMYLWA